MKKKVTINYGKEFLKGIGIVLLFYSFPLLYQLIFYDYIKSSNTTLASLVLLLGEILTIIIFIYLNKDKLKGMLKDFKKNKEEYIDTMVKFYCLGFFLMIITNFIINIVLKMGMSENETIIRDYLKIYPIYYVPSACLLGPIVEELAFKVSFKNAFKNKWIFIIFTSLLFASAHIFSSYTGIKDLLYIIPYSTLAFSFSTMYANTNNPLTNIITHIFHNTVTIMLYLIIL